MKEDKEKEKTQKIEGVITVVLGKPITFKEWILLASLSIIGGFTLALAVMYWYYLILILILTVPVWLAVKLYKHIKKKLKIR